MSLSTYTPESDADAELTKLVSSLTVSSWEKKLELFQTLHDMHIRRSDLVVQHGYDLITKHKSKLGDQLWSIYEKVFIAALDVNNDKISQECLRALRTQFPKSLRVKRLNGMYAEAHGHWDEANGIYDEILTEDPAHAPTLKRKIAIARARNQWDRCIELLRSYTQIFSQDEVAWIELASIYVQQTKFELAKFCYEELILLSPENYLHHILLADVSLEDEMSLDVMMSCHVMPCHAFIYQVLFTLDSKDKSAARHYYIQSLELKPHDNLRALYGLLLCLRHQRDTSHVILYDSTVERILQHYNKASTPQLAAIVKEAIIQ